jgi:hypothetical protein
MAHLSKVVTNWAGAGLVGPGATVTYCNEGDESTLTTALATFFTSVKPQVSTGVQWTFPNSGDVIDENTGRVVSHWSAAAPSPISSTGAATFANGVGARLKFPTIGIVNGRSVTGAIFIVPLVTNAYEGAGNLTAATITALGGAAAVLGNTPNALRIYSRPTPTRGGVSFPSLPGSCPDLVSWLRSRRI